MTTSHARSKVSALLWLAGGKSNRVAAEAAGVAPSTIAAWKKDPVFAAELAAVTEAYQARPQDAQLLLDRLDQAEQRFRPDARDGTVHVRVTVPAGATTQQRRKAVARGLARGITTALRDRA